MPMLPPVLPSIHAHLHSFLPSCLCSCSFHPGPPFMFLPPPFLPFIHALLHSILTEHYCSCSLLTCPTFVFMFTPLLPSVLAPFLFLIQFHIHYFSNLHLCTSSYHIHLSSLSNSYYSFHIFSYSLPLFIIPASPSCVCFFPNPSCISSAACGSSLFGCALLTHLYPHYLFMLTHFSSYFRFYCQGLSFSFYLI